MCNTFEAVRGQAQEYSDPPLGMKVRFTVDDLLLLQVYQNLKYKSWALRGVDAQSTN